MNRLALCFLTFFASNSLGMKMGQAHLTARLLGK
jgi:hypothetical protein